MTILLIAFLQAFYAVKCHPNEMMIRTLAGCGAGFDCASRAGVPQLDSNLESCHT